MKLRYLELGQVAAQLKQQHEPYYHKGLKDLK
jgi:hypothetical protein